MSAFDNRPLARLWECSQSGGKTIRFFYRSDNFLLCPPDWLHSHRRARVYTFPFLFRFRWKLMKNHVSLIAYWFPISIVNCYWMISIGIDFDWLTNLLIAFTRGTISSEPGILYYIVLYYSILYCIILYCLYILSVNCVLNVWKWICIATNWELDNLWYTYMVAVYTYIGARHTQSVEIDHRTTNQSIKTYRCWLVNWYQLASANWWSIDSQIRLSADYVNCHWLYWLLLHFRSAIDENQSHRILSHLLLISFQ